MMMTNDFSRRATKENEKSKMKKDRGKRKGEVLSGIIWRALLLCISSNNMLSTSECRQDRKRMVLQNPMLVSLVFFCSHLVVSIEHYLFDETETRAFSFPPLNIQL